jgi:phenylacetate-coenzyme A ligase PaaK-like adenylate-forming protein
LNNPWNYLVRFNTGDIVRLEDKSQCPCGRDSGIILSSIEGRAVNLTIACEGRLVTLGELDNAISRLQDIDEYKLIQVDPKTYELHIATQLSLKEPLKREAIAILKDLYGKPSSVSVVFEDAIAPEASGKYLISRCLFPIDVEEYLDTSIFRRLE